jgi:Flp pilus assembly pilin Flp
LRLWARAQLWWFERGESGATAVEYAIMLALIAAVIVGAVGLLGNATNSDLQKVSFSP